MAIRITPLQASDYTAWAKLFQGFLTHCQTSLPEEQLKQTFARLTAAEAEGGNISCLAAWDDGDDSSGVGPVMVGIAQYTLFASSWSEKMVCVLSDLFVDPTARKQGIGRKLILAVAAAAEETGCLGMKWSMHRSNTAVQKLYESLAVSDFVEYRMKIPFVGES